MTDANPNLPNDAEQTDHILDLLAEGHTPSEVAEALIDGDVAAGKYAGCSPELEIAYTQHKARVERISAAGSS